MDVISNPHDRLFKEIWSDTDTARDFLRRYLPENVVALLDLASLEICKDSFVQEDLREYFSDLLYRVSFAKRTGYVYLLFEHKSHPEKLLCLQLLTYIRGIWELHLKRFPLPLPVVVPMVLYHGPERWRGSNELIGLLGDQDRELLEFVPNFKYILHDLSRYSDEEIKGAVLSRVGMLLLKYAFAPGFGGKLPEILSLMRALLEKETGMQYIEGILRYVLHTVEGMGKEELKTMVEENLSAEKGELIMTLAQQLKNEGIQQGIEQGIQQGITQGIQQGLLEGIELALSVKFGARGMKLVPAIRRVRDPDRLEAIMEAIKVSKRLSELEEVVAG